MRFYLLALITILSGCEQATQHLALGTLERDRIAHTATVSEVVTGLPVSPGTEVTKGMLLVQLDNTLATAQVSKAKAEVSKAEANLEKLRNGARIEDVAAARAKLDVAKANLFENRTNYQRIKDLAKQKVVSKSELDRALSTRDASLANLQNAREELLKLTNGTRAEDLHAAEAELDSVQASLASEQKRLADLSIIATRDGILDNLPWNLGERVTLGSPLAVVLAGKAPYARIYVPEPYRVKVKVGDTLNVRVDGIEKTITGTLRWISTDPAFTPYFALNQEERARLMYLAEVQLPDSESALPNGVPAQVELP